MSMSDPISDYLTRIRNAHMASKPWVDIPSSSLKIRISYVLKEEKFIRDYILIKDDKQNILRLYLKYDFNNNIVITADTIAYCGRRLVDKTSDKKVAKDNLSLLSGRRHKVLSVICVRNHLNKIKYIQIFF